MKLILNIIFELILSQGFAQQQVDLSAHFYPNSHLSEKGHYLEEFYDSIKTINTIYIKIPKGFLDIDSLGLHLDEIVITYGVWNVDTIIYDVSEDSIIIEKNSIYVFAPDNRPFLFFEDSTKNGGKQYQYLMFCQKKSKYSVQLEYLSKNKLGYILYFSNNCNQNQVTENIIRSGEIKLKEKKRKSISQNISITLTKSHPRAGLPQ